MRPNDVLRSAPASDDDFEPPAQKKTVLEKKKSKGKPSTSSLKKSSCSDPPKGILNQSKENILKYLKKNEFGSSKASAFQKVKR